MPLGTKIILFITIIFAVAALFLFGVTFLFIAIGGGVVTWLASLFGGRKRNTMHHPSQFPFKIDPDIKRSPQRQKDDDIIDI